MGFIAHISDLHFGREDPQVTEGLLQDIRQSRPDLIAISGDLTQRARNREFVKTQSFLRLLPCPYVVVPGNHDVPALNLIERLFRPFSRYCRYITADLSPVYQGDDFVVAGINTARRFRFGWDWSRGKLSKGQLDRLKRILTAESVHGLRIVVVHHPFLLSLDTARRGRIAGFKDALACFREIGVRLVLSGHLHKTMSGIIVPDFTKRSVVAVEAGTAISTRAKYEPNAYNWIQFDTGKIMVTVRTWQGSLFNTSAISEYPA